MNRQCWTFPERNGEGKVVGISTRDRQGQKKRITGSKSGLTFASDWREGTGPIFLVEGASDTAALKTIGLAVVGRPSNLAGVGQLTDLLFDIATDREIIVGGERDQKPNGSWPGREGAISVSTQLAEALDRTIGWALPPDDAKDSRAWLQAMPELPVERLADLFKTGIDIKRVNPPITLTPAPEPKNTLPLNEWRATMFQDRLQSLGHPGIYLDHSPTGAGKSRVDFEAIRVLLQRGAAA
ncbi:MAG: hypothetical protein EXS05_19220 [Planctomycetaceae bacterium]|nr:hypothetical protein [Planctomycetaceae bacterium]